MSEPGEDGEQKTTEFWDQEQFQPLAEKFGRDPARLAEAHLQLEHYRGRSIALPKDENDVDALRDATGKLAKRFGGEDKLFQALGKSSVPEKVDDYKLPAPQGYELTDGDKTVLNRFKTKMHADGVPPAVAARSVEFLYELVGEQQQQARLQQAEDQSRMEEAFGPNWQSTIAVVDDVKKRLGLATDDPVALMEAHLKLARRLGESTSVKMGESGETAGVSLDELREQYNGLLSQIEKLPRGSAEAAALLERKDNVYRQIARRQKSA